MNFAAPNKIWIQDDSDMSASSEEEELDVNFDDNAAMFLSKASAPARGPRRGRAPAPAPAAPSSVPVPTARQAGLFAAVRSKLSGRSSSSAALSPPAPERTPRDVERETRRECKKKGLRKKLRQAEVGVDTNVVAVKFSTLAAGVDIATGDPVVCSNPGCQAVFSTISKTTSPAEAAAMAEARAKELAALPGPGGPGGPAGPPKDTPPEVGPPPLDVEEGQVVWTCEFCGTQTAMDELDEEELPIKEEYDYVVEPAPQVSGVGAVGEEQAVIFCIDISGSMCVTTEVPGEFKLKGLREQSEFDGLGQEFRDDIMAQRREQRRGSARKKKSTYVSRLQCVQAAVAEQLQDFQKTHPNKQVGLVTFSNEVTIIGDGLSEPVVLAGDRLKDMDELRAKGQGCGIKTSIAESHDALSDKLFALEEHGATALGPALVVAIAMAAQTPGSSVVICTDGLANVGLGSLATQAGTEKDAVEAWFDGVANVAKHQGVTVNVISIQGAECALEDLGKVAEVTGGSVSRVAPLELASNFAAALALPVVATNVSCLFILHKALGFRNEEQLDEMDADSRNRIRKEVGNVTAETELMFEFGASSSLALKRMKGLSDLPFQLQIHFRRTDGMKCMRVISRTQKVTNDRGAAEAAARLDILSANVQMQSARLAEKGSYRKARACNRRVGRLMARRVQSAAADVEDRQAYSSWAKDMRGCDDMYQVQEQQVFRSAAAQGLDMQSDDSADEEIAMSVGARRSQKAGKMKKKKAKKAFAKALRKDVDYDMVHQAKHASSARSKFTKRR